MTDPLTPVELDRLNELADDAISRGLSIGEDLNTALAEIDRLRAAADDRLDIVLCDCGDALDARYGAHCGNCHTAHDGPARSPGEKDTPEKDTPEKDTPEKDTPRVSLGEMQDTHDLIAENERTDTLSVANRDRVVKAADDLITAARAEQAETITRLEEQSAEARQDAEGWQRTAELLQADIHNLSDRWAESRAGARRSSRGRILWNRRPDSSFDGGDIDEIVIHHPNVVHIEQMNERCWWIGIATQTGEWAGNFVTDSRGRMTFFEQENDGVLWEQDESHDLEDTNDD